MRAATIFAAFSTAALAQSAAEYPYGYWDVSVKSVCTDGCTGWLRNLTIVFTDDNRYVSDAGKEYHCYSQWSAATLVETKKCDNSYLDFIIADKTLWTKNYLDIFQHFYWGGRGEPSPNHTVMGGVNLGEVLKCDSADVYNCEGAFKVNATTLLY